MNPQTSGAFWSWANVFPITAVVAILLFLARELLESRRRGKSKQRQIEAFKIILARECEYNYWPLRRLGETSEFLAADEQNYTRLGISENATRPFVFIRENDGSSYGFPLSGLSQERMSNLLLDVAQLDAKLFKLVEAAYDALAQAGIVRSQLSDFSDSVGEAGNKELIRQIAPQWLRSITEAETALQALYTHCTGKKLERGRAY